MGAVINPSVQAWTDEASANKYSIPYPWSEEEISKVEIRASVPGCGCQAVTKTYQIDKLNRAGRIPFLCTGHWPEGRRLSHA